MKNVYALLITVFVCSNSFSQNYIPFPEENAVWIQASYLYSFGHEHTTITESLEFGSDSIHNMVNYHTLSGNAVGEWIDGWGSQQNYQTGIDYGLKATVLMRQDIGLKQVYIWSNLDNQEVILYDFNNLVVGQPYPPTYNNLSYPDLLVMAYDSVMLNDGLYHEKWVLGSNSNDSGFVSVIEGVGATTGFDLPIALPFEQTYATLCFSINEMSIYDAWNEQPGLIPAQYSENCKANLSISAVVENEISISPNPIGNDYFVIDSKDNIDELKMYDLMGRLVLTETGLKSKTVEISSSSLNRGSYILVVQLENGKLFSTQIVK